MATSLQEIRAKLQAQESRSPQSGGDGTVYPHWNIDEGTTARLRFLPDGNTKNTFFWVERALINLEFTGIKGQPDSKRTVVQVPCVEMWGDACPILAEVRTWFKDPSLEEMGRKYWKKRSYIFQGFVRDNPIKEDNTPVNPIRRFIISPQIFALVKSALLDPELENLPTDYSGGLDFLVAKTSKGGYSDYSTSKWSRKESALTADETAAIEQHGLFDLAEFLPKKPSAAELTIMKEMFEASVDGQPYDTDKWGAYFRPRGVFTTNAASAPTNADRAVQTESVTAASSTVETSDSPFIDDEAPIPTASAVAPPAAGGQRAEDILAMIRNRQTKA